MLKIKVFLRNFLIVFLQHQTKNSRQEFRKIEIK